MTVRIVPSTGLPTAPYAVWVPRVRAFARSRPLKRRFPARPSAIPRRIWLVITPELPRAPISAPWLTAAAIRSAGASRPTGLRLVEGRADRRQHVRARVAVRDREHVQGVDLVDVRLEVGDRAPQRLEEPGAGAVAASHQATSVPLAARSSGPIRSRVRGGRPSGGPPGSASRRPVRSPSTWIVSRSTSRPSARRTAYRTAESTWRATSAIGRPWATRQVEVDRELRFRGRSGSRGAAGRARPRCAATSGRRRTR